MRVLMVHDEPIDRGYGAETYVRRLVAGLRAAGDEVEVVAGDIRHEGLGRVRDIWDPAARTLIDQRAQRFSPDVINFHNIARELSPSVLAAVAQIPAVMTVHDFRLLGSYEHSPSGPRGWGERSIAGRIRRRAAARLAATIGVSERVSEALRRYDFPRVSMVPVPVSDPLASPLPVAGCRDVAVVARLTKDKGVDVAIRAFAAATSEQPAGRRLVVAGDGPERSRLEQLAGNGRDRFVFAGQVSEAEVSALLGQVRAVVVASQPRHRPEGSSITLAEAAIHGRPVVASSDPAVAELAASLGGALVVDARDVDGFTRALERLLHDDDLATELGAQGQANASRLHSVAAVTAATRAVYAAAVGEPTP
jgi:glycosyltransferase involved in cell wall biosynthesis